MAPILSGLSGLVESDSEDATLGTLDAYSPPTSISENATGSKVKRKNAASTRKESAKMKGPGRPKAVSTKTKRAPLKDKTNQQYASDTEEVDEFAQEDVTMEEASGDEVEATLVSIPPPKPRQNKAKPAPKGEKPKTTSSRSKASSRIQSPERQQIDRRGAKDVGAQASKARQPSVERKLKRKIIPETQPSAMEVDGYGSEEAEDETLKLTKPFAIAPRAQSRPRQVPPSHRRLPSVSDNEGNEPGLRRQLGEITKKFENLDLKYRNLREVGVVEAEQNFERLKKQSSENQKIASQVIASLKADLEKQKKQAQESAKLKAAIESQSSKMSDMEAKVAQLTAALADAKAENKALATKLAANRTAATSVESIHAPRAPGSAVKANGGVRLMGSAETAQAIHVAQLKENLYSDLTGLIIRDVKREDGDDVYDCIQTGRNGTLHFKLAAGNEKGGESYDDAQCIYIPQLDPRRDEVVMDLLQDYDYLMEEITFPRSHSGKFYARLFKALTDRVSRE